MENQQTNDRLPVVRHDLYAGKSERAALELLEDLQSGELSLWDGPSGRPCFVFMHYAVQDEAPQILSHVAKSNPVLKLLAKEPRATFWVNGPSAYIPSHWYGSDRRVPTSYYSWAQFEVSVQLVEDEPGKLDILAAMLARLQPEGGHPPMDTGEKYWQGMVGAITGMEMTIQASQSRHRYGQNRPAEVRRRIAAELETRNEGQDRAVAAQVLDRLEEGATA